MEMRPPPRRRRALSADRSAINARLATIPRAYEELLAAAARLGEPLVAEAVARAGRSDDPALRNVAGALERAIEKLVNFLVEVADRGLREAERAGHASATTSGRSFERLREAGLLSPGQRDRLTELIDVRNLIQHDYVAVAPEQIVGAVEILRADLHSLVRVLDGWLREVDGGSPPRGR